MSRMIEGRWHTQGDIATVSKSGSYEREDSVLRNWIGEPAYPAESGRYHLYVAYNCPWAHRTLLLRAAKALESVISVSVSRPRRTDQGWVFDNEDYRDHVHGFDCLHQVYSHAVPDYTGRVTVPALYDRHSNTIVSNESADIIRMLNSGFNEFTDVNTDFYPESHRNEIDRWNERIYRDVNNGVYRAGFAETQAAYDDAVMALFSTLDDIDLHLESSQYLVGDVLTEADWRLFPTLARFDVAYHGAFKCNRKRVVDYPNLWRYARQLFHLPGVADTVRFDAYKQGYYSANAKRNPLGIVPIGPEIDWSLSA